MRFLMLGATTLLSSMALANDDVSDVERLQNINCAELNSSSSASFITDCEKKGKETGNQEPESVVLETKTVTANSYSMEEIELTGRYKLNREFIEALPKNNGDFTELLTVIPGVSLGDESLDIDKQAEIKAQRVSINNGQAWQTGFFIDGLNFNSRQDPGSSSTSANDVTGAAQTVNLSTRMLESIEVYDNNIPAQYGGFSGGVVEVSTLKLNSDEAQYGFSYRTSRSEWNEYRVFVSEDENGDEPNTPQTPEFKKETTSAYYQGWLNSDVGILLNASKKTSVISDTSFQALKKESRKNHNLLMKISHYDLGLDLAEFTLTYAPYESNEFKADVLNSEFTVEGGGFYTNLKFEHYAFGIDHSMKLSFSESYNSRQAPQHYYKWLQRPGKNWGQLDSDQDSNPQLSQEGGYGDIDKTQRTLNWNYKLNFAPLFLANSQHNISSGLQYSYEQQIRNRNRNTYVYQSAIDGIENLNCSGFVDDCVENGVDTAPQYFSLRQVYHQEEIDVNIHTTGAYLTDSIEWGNVSLNLGLRYDTESFLKNHNIAPRISLGYHPSGSKKTLLTTGFNRYYDSNMLTYKIREQQIPYSYQRREVNSDDFVQAWEDVSGASSYRYLFNEVDTPYNDEFMLGIKQANQLGAFSIKYVRRWQRDQLLTESTTFNPADGYYYKNIINADNGENQRLSLSWAKNFGNHNAWGNTSYQLSSSYEFEESVDSAAVSDIVFIKEENGYTESTTSNIGQYASEFGQPITINLGVSSKLADKLTLSLTSTISEGYKTYVDTGRERATEQIERICATCDEFDYILVPVYERKTIKTKSLFNAGLKWSIALTDKDKITLSSDINNLFNSRTYSTTASGYGIETGRSFWFGISYDH